MARSPVCLLVRAADAIALSFGLAAYLMKRRLLAFEGDASEAGEAPRVRVVPARRGSA